MKYILLLAAGTLAFAAPPTYKVLSKIKIGGAPRWDYIYVDSANHRLYVAHSGQNTVEVVDTTTDKLIATIPDTKGVHGVAIANDLGKGFTSNGASNDVTIFDLKTNKETGRVKTGQNPDSIIYEPVTHRILTMNGASKDATIIDAKTGQSITASLPVGGKPEFGQIDGKGHVYVNIEDKNEIIEIDAKDATVTKHYSIAPCDSPSGMAIDPSKNYLFSVCDGKVMVVSDPATGKVIATPKIGEGPDGVAFDDGYAFSANGKDGTITMVGLVNGKYAPVATITTQVRARTIGADQKAHKLYLPTVELGPADAKGGKGPQPVADSFEILVVGR